MSQLIKFHLKDNQKNLEEKEDKEDNELIISSTFKKLKSHSTFGKIFQPFIKRFFIFNFKNRTISYKENKDSANIINSFGINVVSF